MRTLTILGMLLTASPALAADDLAAGDLALTSASGLAAGDALAQDEEEEEDEGDVLDDILSGESRTESAGEERAALERGEIGDNIGARDAEPITLDEEERRKTLIKTVQRKNFMKLGRWEVSPHLAFVANDPFLNRYIVGTGINYNLTEIFALEVSLDYAPDFGRADWKPLTTQLVEENSVSPDISKMTFSGNLSFLYSPIYGKVAVGKRIINFDIYGAFGAGATLTNDDLDALQTDETDLRAVATQVQTHPTTNIGGGARIIFTPNLAARIEGRSLVYIETVNSTTLEMKNMFILQGAFSVFFPTLRN